MASPLTILTPVMDPCLLTVASSPTAPSLRNWRAIGGYTGGTFFTSSPCEIPCETGKTPAATLGSATLLDTILASASELLDSAIAIEGGAGCAADFCISDVPVFVFTISGLGLGVTVTCGSAGAGNSFT